MRRLVSQILRDVATMVENDSTNPLKHLITGAAVINSGRTVTEHVTQQTLHAVVLAIMTESEEEARMITGQLRRIVD